MTWLNQIKQKLKNFLLQENGAYLLLEDGGRIILDDYSWKNLTKY